MSVENLKEYARRCAMEPELRASAKKIGLRNMEQHQEKAASLGLDWTMDDMAALRKELGADNELEAMEEEDLQQVAGGVVTVTIAVLLGVAVGIAVAASDSEIGDGGGW